MSIIRCSEKCVHQQDGYCDVNTATNSVAGADAPCVYYIENKKTDIEKKEDM